MRTNCVFDTYRRATSGSTRIYSASKTISAGVGMLMPAPGELKAILDMGSAVKAFTFSTNLRDFERYDKITVTFPTEIAGDYFVEQLEQSTLNGCFIYRLILRQDG